MVPRTTAWILGSVNLGTAALVVFGVFGGLPARWRPVDTAAVTIAIVEVGAAVGLFTAAPWGARVARAAAAVVLAFGLLAVTLLAATASWLSGVYGPIGLGGAVVLALVATLALPYLVVVPVVELILLRPARADERRRRH